MHSRSALILSLGIMAIAGYAAISALAWPLKTALFPLVISIPLFCLAAAETFFLWRSRPQVSTTNRPRALRAAAWIVGFFVLIVLSGFLVAVPLFVLLYLKLESREGWVFSVLFSAIVWGAFYGLFDYLLHLPFNSGLLLSWFSAG